MTFDLTLGLPSLAVLGLVSGALAFYVVQRAWWIARALVQDGVTPHLRYLYYVLLHKLYVYRAGRLIGVRRWRLLVHDRSKFSRHEWRPYVRRFYGAKTATAPNTAERAEEQRSIEYRFNLAWNHHQKVNAHHWQHWVMRLDDRGREITLTPPVEEVDEMLADWIGAGTKILARPSIEACIIETVRWYAQSATGMMLREPARLRIEGLLVSLAHDVTIPPDPDGERAAKSYS